MPESICSRLEPACTRVLPWYSLGRDQQENQADAMSMLSYPWPTGSQSSAGLRHLLLGLVIGLSLGLSSTSLLSLYRSRKRVEEDSELPDLSQRPIEVRTDEVVKGVSGLIGNTLFLKLDDSNGNQGTHLLFVSTHSVMLWGWKSSEKQR